MIILVNLFYIAFLLKCFDFFYFLGQFNDFIFLGSNVDNNFNCYSNENNGNVGIDFQFMFFSFVDRKLTTYFCYLIIAGIFIIYILFLNVI